MFGHETRDEGAGMNRRVHLKEFLLVAGCLGIVFIDISGSYKETAHAAVARCSVLHYVSPPQMYPDYWAFSMYDLYEISLGQLQFVYR